MKPLESTQKFKDDDRQQQVLITFKHTAVKNTSDGKSLQIFNLVFKRCLQTIGLTEFGKKRAYFDFKEMNPIRSLNVNILSGFFLTMRPTIDGRLLLLTEVSNKLISQKTVLDVVAEIKSQSRSDEDFRNQVINELVGQTVITMYNTKTYRISDIDWSSKPSDTFETKKGPESFDSYYRRAYQITRRDLNQPLLVINPTAKDIEAGRKQPILLIPELCSLTGEIRRELANFTARKRRSLRLYMAF